MTTISNKPNLEIPSPLFDYFVLGRCDTIIIYSACQFFIFTHFTLFEQIVIQMNSFGNDVISWEESCNWVH